jgi:transposase InsO family protein
MSRKDNCRDNAISESFFHTLKIELVHYQRYQTRVEAKQNLFEYIEVFYIVNGFILPMAIYRQ